MLPEFPTQKTAVSVLRRRKSRAQRRRRSWRLRERSGSRAQVSNCVPRGGEKRSRCIPGLVGFFLLTHFKALLELLQVLNRAVSPGCSAAFRCFGSTALPR